MRCFRWHMRHFIGLLLGTFLSLLACRSETNPEWEILNEEVKELFQKGKYDRAMVIAKKALEVAESADLYPHNLASSLNNLAFLYYTKGQYEMAEPFYKRALKINKKAFGPDHPSVATNLNNLASLYNTQGKYTLAEPLYNQALKIYEKALGPDHPNTTTNMENLALLYRATARNKKAEELERRVERIQAIRP